MLISASVAAFFVALGLPSYAFIPADHQNPTLQVGIQSFKHSPIGMAYAANIFYGLTVMVALTHSSPTLIRRLLSGILLATLFLSCFGFIMGDPQPGSKTTIGPGAYLWFCALVVAAFASFPDKGSDLTRQ